MELIEVQETKENKSGRRPRELEIKRERERESWMKDSIPLTIVMKKRKVEEAK